MIRDDYGQFSRLARLHRQLIGQVDQKVGAEKATMRKYIAAIDRRLVHDPSSAEHFRRWRRESGMSGG